LAGQPPEGSYGALAGVDVRQAAAVEPHGDDRAAAPRAVALQHGPQDGALARDAGDAERAIAEEVAEAVGDHAAVVPLAAAEDVRPVSHDEVGASTHDGVRERNGVAARLTEERLRPRPYVLTVGALGAGVHGHDDDVRLPLCAAHDLHRGADVEQALRPG